MNTLIQAVRHALEQAGLCHAQARLLCAVSGGADSMALLHALCALRGETGFTLHACHVQHGLRGDDSLADEAFVRDACKAMNVPLRVENAGLCATMHSPGVENSARSARRAIFARLMQAERMDALLLAHHRDDQAETVLMRLLRGAGAEGLGGMQPQTPFAGGWLIRPFLALSGRQLRDALAGQGLSHREDMSNHEAVTLRNTLRLNVLPQLEALMPGAAQHMAAAADSLRADESCLAQQADALYEACVLRAPTVFALQKAPLLKAHEALARRVVRRWWREAVEDSQPQERSLSHADTLAVLDCLRQPAGHTLNLPGDVLLITGAAHLHLTCADGCALFDEALPVIPVQKGLSSYRLPLIDLSAGVAQAIPSAPDGVVIPPRVLAMQPVLRTPLPGDRIHPLGASGSKPLRRFLTDRKIDPCFRHALPVLAVEQDVLWIPTIVTAEMLRIDSIPDGHVYLAACGAPCFNPQQTKE